MQIVRAWLTYTVKTELVVLYKICYIVGISEFSLMILRYHQLNDVYKYFQAPKPQYFAITFQKMMLINTFNPQNIFV